MKEPAVHKRQAKAFVMTMRVANSERSHEAAVMGGCRRAAST